MGYCHRWRGLSTRSHEQGSRDYRNDRHRAHHRNRIHHYYLVGLLSVSALFAPAKAAEVSNIAGPSAGATANNTNQQVQINNNGAPSRQYFGKGISCNGATLNVTPFYMGNDVIGDPYVRGNNWGIQIGIAAPLDGGVTELCKDVARKRLYKESLDAILVRALKCAELADKGYMFKPGTASYAVCSDVVSIAAYQKFQGPDDRVILQDASHQSLLQALEEERAALKELRQRASQRQQQQTMPQQ